MNDRSWSVCIPFAEIYNDGLFYAFQAFCFFVSYDWHLFIVHHSKTMKGSQKILRYARSMYLRFLKLLKPPFVAGPHSSELDVSQYLRRFWLFFCKRRTRFRATDTETWSSRNYHLLATSHQPCFVEEAESFNSLYSRHEQINNSTFQGIVSPIILLITQYEACISKLPTKCTYQLWCAARDIHCRPV